MQRINQEINRLPGYDPQKYYLIVVQNAQGGIKGFMPRARNKGFIVAAGHGSLSDLGRTMAHELGHGAFRLRHPWEQFSGLAPGQTDNLMDYASGTRLHHYQWHIVHNPPPLAGLLDGDEEGELVVFDPAHVQQIQNSNLTQEQINCLLAYSEYISQNQEPDSESLVSFCSDFAELFNIPLQESEQVNNGIQIVSSHVPSVELVPGRLLAATRYRFPHNPPHEIAPDLISRYDGDYQEVLSGGNISMATWSNQQLEQSMTRLIRMATNSVYQPVGNKLLAKFYGSTGGVYSDSDLSELIIHTQEFKNKVKDFGHVFNHHLMINGGDVSQISELTLNDNRRFVFSWRDGYLFMGPTILINDVSQVKYHLQSFDINQNGVWNAAFYVEAIDHFGLDDNDPNNSLRIPRTNLEIPYQFLDRGFAAWWLLQHTRGYVPFRTKMRFVVFMQGQIILRP